MLDKNNKRNVAYACTMDLLSWPHGKKRIILKETREKAALVLQIAEEAVLTNQPFVMVGSIVDLTTLTKIMQGHDAMDVNTPTSIRQAKDSNDSPRDDVVDLTTPSSVVQAKITNKESDFLLQDTDEEQELGGSNAIDGDGSCHDLAFHLQ